MFRGKNDTPCYGCMRRKEGCHSACEEYRLFREAKDAEIQRRTQAHEGDCNSVVMRNQKHKRLRKYSRHK